MANITGCNWMLMLFYCEMVALLNYLYYMTSISLIPIVPRNKGSPL